MLKKMQSYGILFLFMSLLIHCGPSKEEKQKSLDESYSKKIIGKWYLCAQKGRNYTYSKDSCTFLITPSPNDSNEIYGEVHYIHFTADSIFYQNIPFSATPGGKNKITDTFSELFVKLDWKIKTGMLYTSTIRKYKILKLEDKTMELKEEK